MQLVHNIDQFNATLVGYGVRVMLIAQGGEDAALVRRMAALGGRVEHHAELFAGLEAVIEDPAGYGLCVIDCDAIGGIDTGRRAFALMAGVMHKIPVILVSSDSKAHEFPTDRTAPVVLRAPITAVSMRVAFEHALRDRLVNRLI